MMNRLSFDQIVQARAARIEDELARRGFPFWTKARNNNLGQPCPMCGGKDRFSVNTKKQVFHCRGCGAAGNVIKLVEGLDGVGFQDAVVTLTGKDAGNSAPSRSKKPLPIAENSASEDADRQRAINSARIIWGQRKPITRTTAEKYLYSRGIPLDEDLLHVFGFDPASCWREVAGDPASPLLRVPCLFAVMHSIDGDDIVAVQKTRLAPQDRAPLHRPPRRRGHQDRPRRRCNARPRYFRGP